MAHNLNLRQNKINHERTSQENLCKKETCSIYVRTVTYLQLVHTYDNELY